MTRVLVVDDSPTIRRVVATILEGQGYETLLAEDGEAALVQLRERPFDLVLSDFVMPKLNGFQLCREIKADARLADVPVVLMSAKGDKLRGQLVQQTGAVDAITKPFDPLALVAVIENALARKKTPATPSLEPPPQSAPRNGDPPSEPSRTSLLPPEPPRATETGAASSFGAALSTLVARAVASAPGVRATPQALESALASVLTPAKLAELQDLLQRAVPQDELRVILSGDLSCISIPEVLQMLELQRQTGALTISSERGEIVLFLREGLLDFARGSSLSRSFRLGRYLVQTGAVERDKVRRFLEVPRATKRLLGEAMVENGMVNDAQVVEALRVQTSELVYEVVGWRQGRFTFVRGGSSPEAALAALGLTPGGIVMEGFRRVDEWRLIEGSIDFDDTLLRDSGASDRLAESSDLTAEERCVLLAIDGQRSVREIVDSVPASTFDVCKILYQFLNSRIVRRSVA
jgi:CheY-like chemotaxis protein